MKIAIVDDEMKWRERIREILGAYPWKEKIEIGTFFSGETFIEHNGYDIVFLDIEMAKMDGFETAHRYKEENEDVIIIFLTTHLELSRRGYLVNAFRYIDKGNVDVEMREALEGIEVLRDGNHLITFHELRVGEVSIRAKDVLYIETQKHDVIVHTKEREYKTNRNFEELEEELSELGFFRCHKSFLVNLENVYNFDRVYVYFKDGKKAMVSVRKYADLRNKYLLQKHKTANS